MVSPLICLFLSGPWGVIAHHDWLFEHGKEGCGGQLKGGVCQEGAYWGLACRESACRPQKDEEIQAALLKIDVEREKIIQKFK